VLDGRGTRIAWGGNVNAIEKLRPVTLFLCGDVMTGRGLDQVLPCPSNPVLHEPYVQSALEYVEMAEAANGRIPKPVSFSYVWGEAIEDLDRAQPDARIVNLETAVTTHSNYEHKGINYRMHPANVPCLSAAKIGCCVVANNHVLDWGRPGLADTLCELRNAGIKTAGAGSNLAEAMAPAVIEVEDRSRVLVFAAGLADSGIELDWAATESNSGVALLPNLSGKTAGHVTEQVAAVKRPGDIAVLSIHWGGNWGYEIPREHQAFAHALIERAAVDVIHGHSSHHPKGIELHHGKPILYGCGDFLNDYEGISGHEEFRSHLVLGYFLTLDSTSGVLLSLEMVPFEIRRFQLQRASAEDAKWLRNRMARECRPSGVTLDGGNRLVLSRM
jgi:poly-gamma-glutamate capsule biosynthesis protein CapA/YwtB (metallophosphatase superfamily)